MSTSTRPIWIDAGTNVFGTGGANKIAISYDGSTWTSISTVGMAVTYVFIPMAKATVLGVGNKTNSCEIRIKHNQGEVVFDIQDVQNQSGWLPAVTVPPTPADQGNIATALNDINSW